MADGLTEHLVRSRLERRPQLPRRRRTGDGDHAAARGVENPDGCGHPCDEVVAVDQGAVDDLGERLPGSQRRTHQHGRALPDAQRPDPIREDQGIVTLRQCLGQIRQGRSDRLDRGRLGAGNLAEKCCRCVG